MPIRITLDDVLRRQDMSRRELSRRTSVHRDTVCKYAGNRVRIVSLDILEALCEELHCSLSDLLTEQPDTTVPRPSERPPAAHAHGAPTSQVRRPTIAELEALLARKEAGTMTMDDVKILAAIKAGCLRSLRTRWTSVASRSEVGEGTYEPEAPARGAA